MGISCYENRLECWNRSFFVQRRDWSLTQMGLMGHEHANRMDSGTSEVAMLLKQSKKMR